MNQFNKFNLNREIPEYDAVVVGAGFAGMYMLYRLRQLGLKALVVEKASGIGGTWFWNRYPGARCDIESMQYSYSFSQALAQEWEWSERYACQAEILQYANHVADRFDLHRDILLNTSVISANYRDLPATSQQAWEIKLMQLDGDEGGSHTKTLRARFCIMATGCLSTPNQPAIAGFEEFLGSSYHTGEWPHQPVSFKEKRVALIGTGSSGIQATSVIASEAAHLTVFQRTPNYIVPANNRPFEDGEQDEIKSSYPDLRAQAKLARNGVAQEIVRDSALSLSKQERDQRYTARWRQGGLTFIGAFADLLLNPDANYTAAEYVRDQIRKTVNDPATAELLCPTSTFGCKRLCVDSNYYQTFNRDNVSLVDIHEQGLDYIAPDGPVVNGKLYPVDAIVLATGFDAMTGTLNKIEIRGKNGITLKHQWEQGPNTYLGLTMADFPNLFTITGPGSPSVLSNVLTSIEYHVDWIANCIKYMQENNLTHIEATAEAQEQWGEVVNKIVNSTLYRTCNSWYLGANVSGKARVFMPFPGVPTYEKQCDRIAAEGYPGFNIGCSPDPIENIDANSPSTDGLEP